MVRDVGLNNLHRLNQVRSIVLALELLGLLGIHIIFDIQLVWTPVLLVACLIYLMMVYTYIRSFQNNSVSPREFAAHLVVDTALQTALLFWSGGHTNPLIFVYLILVTVGAALLPRLQSWVITCLTIVCYTVLQKWYQPLSVSGGEGHTMHSMSSMVVLHLAGMWLTFAASACLINGFVGAMASSLRRHRAEIAASREHQLRSERILSVATTAAGAAHELGTPLATMCVVLEELSGQHGESPELAEDLLLLRSQVDICKQRLVSIVEASHRQESTVLPARDFARQVMDTWLLLRPGAPVQWHCPDPFPYAIAVDSSLTMAMINLLNNAVEASPEYVRFSLLHTHAEKQELVTLRIEDRGEGIMDKIASRAGYTTISTKQDGHGLGLQLSVATVERQGGSVQLYTADAGGTVTEVRLPIAVMHSDSHQGESDG